jgi:hypothetical protein
MEVRNLKTSDFFIVAKILSKIGGRALKEIDEQTNSMQAGVLLLTSALENADQDLLKWLADLGGMEAEEFAEQAFDAPITIIEKLAEKEDLTRFFERVRGLVKKISRKQ